MSKRLLLIAMAGAIAAGMAYARQPETKVVIPVQSTSASNGQQMYTDYCASCHGRDGKGNGPAASAFKARPTDLTVLSRNNHGKFPDAHIVAVLNFGTENPAHGSRLMPVWGPIIGSLDRGASPQTQLRISNLIRYLESIQAR